MITNLTIFPPAPYDFKSTAHSSGWVELAPISWDEEHQKVHRVERLSSGKVVLLDITGKGTIDGPGIEIVVTHLEELSISEQNEIHITVGYMLRVDEDLSEFYTMCKQHGGQWVKVISGKGRLLRSPVLFEDVIKTICTTNIQWGGTKRMVSELVSAFGDAYPGEDSQQAFPTSEAIARNSQEAFAESVRLGYRTDYVYTLAQRVASGELDLDALQNTDIPTPELKKELLAIKGIGNYSAATLLMILGRYDELAVDTAFRQFVSKKYFDGGRPSDAEAKAIYEPWGKWKYLAYWFDIWEAYTQGEM